MVAASEETSCDVPLERLGRVFVFGNCSFSAGALGALLERSIPVLHLSSGGTLKGVTTASSACRPHLRRAQWRVAEDSARSLEFARQFVSHKIVNQRVLLLRYRRRWRTLDVAHQGRIMRDLRRSLPTRSSNAEIMGVEGAAARAYFSALRQIVEPKWGFAGRHQRAPLDPVNSLLSFGYSLLLGEIRATLMAVGLDESVGFLHEDSDNRPSLALDLMEAFRPLIVDSLVLMSINSNRLTQEHFVVSTSSGVPGVRLTTEGRRRYFRDYEQRMTTVALHRPSGRVVSYREALLLQTRHLAECIHDSTIPYRESGWT